MGNLRICGCRETAGYTSNVLFFEQRGLDRDKMKLVTNIINAEDKYLPEKLDLPALKARAIHRYNSCSDVIDQSEMNKRIGELGQVHLPAKYMQQYARYLGYKVTIMAEADGGGLVHVERLKSAAR